MNYFKAGVVALLALGFGMAIFLDNDPKKPGEPVAPSATQASMSPQEEYLLDIRMATVPLAQAHAANMCGLRSAQWLSSFDLNYQMQASADVKRLGISPEGRRQGDAEGEKMYRETMGMTSCQSLLNSSAMGHLDELQSQMTGGYH